LKVNIEYMHGNVVIAIMNAAQVIEHLATIGPSETLAQVAERVGAGAMSRMGDDGKSR
jgi:hypothetical protein